MRENKNGLETVVALYFSTKNTDYGLLQGHGLFENLRFVTFSRHEYYFSGQLSGHNCKSLATLLVSVNIRIKPL